MSHKKKGQLTTSSEWAKHLRKIGKRFFWKGERLAERKMIDESISELKTKPLSESEIENAEKLYEYLIIRLPSSLEIKELENLCFSLFCTLDILPENFMTMKITKSVLAVTFMKIAVTKNVANQEDKIDWIERIDNFLERDNNFPEIENARRLIGTN
ncbi:hypothetical protein MG296_10300 [Flavobacteriaceae bacterium TK19130]|nr:hypothetical protein [Thermobacterium salinum]